MLKSSLLPFFLSFSFFMFSDLLYGESYIYHQWSQDGECISHEVICGDDNKFETVQELEVAESNCSRLQGNEVELDFRSRVSLNEPALMISSLIPKSKFDLQSELCKKTRKERVDRSTANEHPNKKKSKPKKSSKRKIFGFLFDVIEEIFEDSI